ncbi:darcynin family protein [Kitasatospora mediocidica]
MPGHADGQVVELLVGTENGYARTYGLEPFATIST